jgi:cell wall-associated NlpC family hydrolase
MITRNAIQQSARKLVGSPWVHQGRSAGTGIDCLGVLIYIAEDLNYLDAKVVQEVNSFYRGVYSRNPDGETIHRELSVYFDEVPVSDAKEGDILVLRMAGQKIPRHVAVLVRGEREMTLIHALDDTLLKKVVEEPYARWKKFVTNAFRFRNIDEKE